MGNTASTTAGFQPNYKDFRLSSPLSDIDPRYDVIVIGSGYGGSIAASRAARAGKRVCVLEKGREWRPGDFPETELKSAKEMQMTIHGDKTIGDPTNLFDVIISPDVAVLQGCGLGGTSLINANVALDCEPKIFEDQVWPHALRDDMETMNTLDKQRAMDMLQPTEYPQHFPELSKMSNMAKAAVHIADIESLDVTSIFKRAPLYVNFKDTEKNRTGIPQPACINCGNCCGGCNTGAKNTLNMNYLPDAKAHGAHIFTQVEVTGVVRDPESDGWRVHYVRHLRKQKSFKLKEQMTRAKVVILGAGALGSTNILLKSKALGLDISPKLGKRFTTNGDVIGFSYNGESCVRAIGKNLVETRKKPHKAPGPSVTSVIDIRDRKGKGVEQSYVIEDGTAPSSVELPYKFLIRWVESGLSGKDTNPEEHDWKEFGRHLSGKSMKNTLALLAMGNDYAGGEVKMDKATNRVWIDYPGIGEREYLNVVKTAMEHTTKSMKGTFIPNPYWGGLAAKMRHTKGVVTAHPLGGCGMSETGADGVVNHAGQVFVGETDELHPGLYVLDGSVMPRSLGINPSLTISVVAERGMRLMAEQHGWNIDFESSKVIDLESTRARPGIRFTERLQGQMTDGDQDKRGLCELILTIESQDVEHMMNVDESHAARVHGTVTCEALSTCPLTVSNGHLTLFSTSVDKVQTREMAYRMNLSSTEGVVFYLRGTKIIHKDSAFEIGKKDTTQVEVIIHMGENADGPVVGKAKLCMKGGDIIKKLSTIEVTNTSGKMERLKWKTKFCTFFMGQMWQIYGAFTSGSTPFDPTASPREKRPLQLKGVEAKPYPIETEDGVEIFLTRYQGGSKGPVMLVHGMGVSSSIFTIDTVETNLLEFLVAAEYDVWILEWRASILLPSAAEKMTLDVCAEYDVPAAVKKILAVRTDCKDIQILSHCAGSALVSATLLSGKLEGKVRSLIISQSGFSYKPTRINWWKSHLKLPQILYGIGVEGLTAYTDSEQNWMGKILDQFFEGTADITTAFGEHCDNHVCHRITFLYGLLYEHSNLNNITHETLHEHFGYGDAKLLKHLALGFKKEYLVDHEGRDVYLPDYSKGLKSDDYKKHIAFLNIPIQFCSGEKNGAFDPESTQIAYDRCKEAHPHQNYERFVVPKYGHIDCIMGKNAAKDVFPEFLTFLEKYA